MKKTLLAAMLVFSFMLAFTASAQAQTPPVVVGNQSFGFDYKDADIAAGAVTRFEIQTDGGPWVSVGVPPKIGDAQTTLGANTYVTPIPALTTGSHTVAVHACNTVICGDSTPALTFILTVKPNAPTNQRIVISSPIPSPAVLSDRELRNSAIIK